MINVVKIGGNIIDDNDKLLNFLKEFAAIAGPKVLIHGGGKEATRLSGAMGIETRMIEGRRVTDRETLDVVTMVYAGLINKRIVSGLQKLGCNAIGLTGADGNVIPAKRRNPVPVDFGYVGDLDPQNINVDFISMLIKSDIAPIFCAICHDADEGLLNCNADSVAASVALALSKLDDVRLSYCFEMPGVLANIDDPDSIIRFITPTDFESLKQKGIISGGMIPKIKNAVDSVVQGVKEVRICRADLLNTSEGTIIREGLNTSDEIENVKKSKSGQPYDFDYHYDFSQPTTHSELKRGLDLLLRLIATPSPSRHEDATARIWLKWLHDNGAPEAEAFFNNIYAIAPGYNPERPTLLLNSHHDTVRPAAGWISDPYKPAIVDGCLRGLGSSDAGGSGVALALTYLQLRKAEKLPFNIVLAITAAEEVMGEHGMRAFLPHLAAKGVKIDMAIVGEPTSLQPSIGERGLIVLDGIAEGIAGHAARKEGVNALYKALEDIEILKRVKEENPSDEMGPIGINITMISSGTQHNVVPDRCEFVVDVRTTDAMSNAQTAEWLQQCVKHSRLTPRSTRVWPSLLPPEQPLFKAAIDCGMTPFLSPTTSDIALLHDIPALKIGPGDSSLSHAPEEALPIDQFNDALFLYPRLLNRLAENIEADQGN